MRSSIFSELGHQIKAERIRRGLTQPELAARLGRDRARISELERDLLTQRLGRDRLTLFAEICDAMDLVPILASRARAPAIIESLRPSSTSRPSEHRTSVFDEVFVDLGDDGDE